MLTAGWLHGGILHIFFNVLWIRQLGPEIANLYGAGRMIIIYTVAGIVGFALSSVMGLLLDSVLRRAGSRSAHRRRSSGSSARWCTTAGAPAAATSGRPGCSTRCSWASWASCFRGIDNAAHLGGFVGGYLASMILDPLKKERIDHIAAARRCAWW